MAVGTGVRDVYTAAYNRNGDVVTYGSPAKLARLVSANPSITTSDDQKFYADDAEAETANGIFTSGTLTLTVDGIDSDIRKALFGAVERTINGVTGVGHSADSDPAYVGTGYIEREMYLGVTYYVPVFFPKTKFNPAFREAQTQGENIEFQSLELSASILRTDAASHDYVFIGGRKTSASDALADLLKLFGAGAASSSGA